MQTFLHYRWRVPSTLHRLHPRRIIPLLLLALCVTGAKAADVPTSWKAVTFNENIRYSQWVINSRIRDFYGNTTQRGFNTYDKDGTQTGSSKGTQKFDYVPGLVAKAVLEAYANYKAFDWSKPWFYSVMNYAKDNKYTLVAKSGVTDFSKITLDNMNACKMYFPLMETGALSDGAKSTGETAIANVLTDMKKYNELYVIGNGSESGVKNSTNETVKSMFGGWFHKPSYKDQMWCDGLYMGAALLAQIVNYKNSTTNVDGTSDWDLITKQFTISWNQLYNSEKGLLYHAFTANPKDNASSAWAGISNTSGSEVYHSAAFWGRAMGWYFLALVDVLEQMPSNNSNRATLIGYLERLAAGLAKYQDGTSGCWYQVVDEKDESLSGNYLESSCTSLFAAAYLKAVRLGFLTSNGNYDYKTIGVNAFKGAVNQFMKYDTFEPAGTTVQLVHNCASAGLGGTNGRTGSREYYIKGTDVGQTNTYTEGKVMGAFIMAATEYELANKKDIRFSYDLAPTYTLAQGGSIKAEALGSGTISYQWFKSDNSEVSGATSETFSPAESGKYYCKATSGSTTIKTSTTTVTVEGTDGIENGGSENGSGSKTVTINNANRTSSDITYTISSGTSWDSNGFYAVNGNATITVKAKEGATISQIKLTYTETAANGVGGSVTVNTGTYTLSEMVGTWTGSANQVVFTTTNAARISSIEVTYTTGTTVLNESDLKYTQSYTNNNAWTPKANGTIDVSELVSSSSTGAYSITSGNDVATISGTTITALKDGAFTLSQAADDKYKEGSIEITVRIGQNVTNDNTNTYSFTAATNVSDGMTITLKDITMTFGNDGFWSKPSTNSYTGGQVNPQNITDNIPTAGTFYKFAPTKSGSLAVKVKLGATGTEGKYKLRALKVSENGTLINATLADGETLIGIDQTPAYEKNSYQDNITFPVKANTDYYVYVTGSKLGFFGFTFEPATLYTVTFNAGTNGTCSTTSLMQESANATITLPSVTPKTGYKFVGWYTAAEEGGTQEVSPYTPSGDITLYARYTSTASSDVIATFVNPTETTWYEKDKNGFTINGVSNIKSDNSAKLSAGGSITLTIPEGYTVTGFDFTLLCANTTVGSTLSVGDDDISVKDGTHTLHHMNLSSSVTGPTTLTIKNSGAKELNIESIKVYGSTDKSISFTTHPQSATYVAGASATALTVAAKVNNVTGTAPTISYKWYRNTTNSTENGTEISGETTASYTPDVKTAGTKYYYCKATATVEGEALEAYSDIATVTVNNPTLTIVTQPVGATYALKQSGVSKLMVEAETNTGNTITYQWYKNPTESSTSGATSITGATSSEYEPAVTAEGTTYYYCEVKAGTLTVNTNIVAIIVNNEQPIYGYKVSKAGLTAPVINTSKYITTTSDESGDTGEKLVKMTFGGWKWKNGTYTKPGSDTQITDSWKDSETVSGVTVLDGYQYWFSGTQDAKQENKDAETAMYGQIRNGWFVSPTRENGITTDSHPYTLPVRGSFMTFEPTKNGTLTIYILQNGAWNTFDKDTQLDGVSYKKGAIKPGEFRMHAFQITNQRGLVLAEFAPNYSVTNNQKVQEGYKCSNYSEKPSTFDKTSTDVSDWEEFWTLSETERKAVHDNWSDAENNGCQKIIKLENGSFLAIQKAVVKYQFHVTGNETYYFFSNFSKMGFSGATFQPDAAQPTDVTTFSGTNSLSDTKDYTEMTMTPNGTIGETGLTNYKYTINNVEVGKVDGVYIPQFKAITLNRTFKKDQWTTLTLPFNLTQTEVEQIFGKGTQILVFQDAITNGTKLHVKFFYHEIQNILPGYPYLIKPTLEGYDNGTTTQTPNAPIHELDGSGNLTSFTVYGKAINPHITQHEFTANSGESYVAKGTPDYCTEAVSGEFCKQYEEGDLFISEGDGKLYISKGSSYGKGYRSYIDGPKSSATKTLSLSFSGVEDGEDDGTTTEISVAELADDVIEAFGIKGVYNLNGQKVAETTRNLPAGIYVVNGRKVVVK